MDSIRLINDFFNKWWWGILSNVEKILCDLRFSNKYYSNESLLVFSIKIEVN